MRNEPAFPLPTEHRQDGIVEHSTMFGLSKREYAAIAAMQGALANPEDTMSISTLASYAVRQADALLAELAKEKV